MGDVPQSNEDDGGDGEDGDDDNDENGARGLFSKTGISHHRCCCPVCRIHSLAKVIGRQLELGNSDAVD